MKGKQSTDVGYFYAPYISLMMTTPALDNVNVKSMLATVKENLSTLTNAFLFEPNDKLTRDMIMQATAGYLQGLKDNRQLYDYMVVCDEVNNPPSVIDRNELHVDIVLKLVANHKIEGYDLYGSCGLKPTTVPVVTPPVVEEPLIAVKMTSRPKAEPAKAATKLAVQDVQPDPEQIDLSGS